MTPQTTATSHLTDIQMGELLDAPNAAAPGDIARAAAEAHLHACATCAAELASLQQTISLFQQASITLAENESHRLRTPNHPAHTVLPQHRPYAQALWLAVASAALITAILPLQTRWHQAPSTPATTASTPHTTESDTKSDEALLQDIDRELSASVPTSMQALSDPAATQFDTQTSTPRKD